MGHFISLNHALDLQKVKSRITTLKEGLLDWRKVKFKTTRSAKSQISKLLDQQQAKFRIVTLGKHLID